MFAGNFAPLGWEWCNGQIVHITEAEMLFQLIGTTYGGDGETTFALPDLRGRLPLHRGPNGFQLGQTGGVETVTLTPGQLPSHHHTLQAAAGTELSTDPAGNVLGVPANLDLYNSADAQTPLNPGLVQPVGGGQPHSNIQPYLSIGFIISIHGLFPSPS